MNTKKEIDATLQKSQEFNVKPERKFKVGDCIRRKDGKSTYKIIALTPYGYKCDGVCFYLSYFQENNYELVR